MSIGSVVSKILSNKLSFVVAAILGSALGLYFPGAGETAGAIGEVFVHILELCLMPIVITSIALSIARFINIKSRLSSHRVVFVLFFALIGCSFFGSGIALLTEPGKHLDFSSSNTLAEMIDKSSLQARGLNDPVESKLTNGFLHLIIESIPKNIFESLSGNKLLQIVVFSIVLGIGMGKFLTPDSLLITMTGQIRNLFYELFEWFLKLFPIALMFLLAQQVSLLGIDPIIAMGNFISKFYLVVVIMSFIALFIIKVNVKATWMQTINIMFEPVLIAMVTQNSSNTIPPSVIALRRFNYNLDLVQLLAPVGAIIGRFGFILYFGFCVVFALQLYGIDLSVTQYILLSLIIALAGIASAGQEEITIAMASLLIVLTPIGIPLEGILPLLLAIDLFIDPFRTALTVQVNCAAITSMDKPQGPILSRMEVEKMDLLSSHDKEHH